MDNNLKMQKLDRNFLGRYCKYDETVEMFELLEKNGRFPRFLYLPEDHALYVQGEEREHLYVISYEVKTLGELEKWFELMFKMSLPF